MRKKLLAVAAMGLLLTGCAGKGDDALDACLAAAEQEVGVDVNGNGVESTNMGDALYEAGIKDERETGDDDAFFTVAGEITFILDGTETRKSMICMVKFENGKAGAPDLTLT